MPDLGVAYDVLNPRLWLRFIQDLPIPKVYKGYSWLPSQDVATEKFLWDMIMSENGMAPFVAVGQESPRFDREQFTEMTGMISRIRHKLTLNESDVQFIRAIDEVLGAPVITNQSALGRQRAVAMARIARDVVRLNEAVDARIEWMQINALLGSVVYAGQKGVSDINFGVNFPVVQVAPVDNTSTGLWSDTVNSNPLLDIQTWLKNLTYSIDTLVYGRDVRFNLERNIKLKNQIYAGGLIKPELISEAQFDNLISAEFGLSASFYDARTTVKVDNGQGFTITQSKILPDNKIIMLPSTPVGFTATAPSPYNNWNTGKFTWSRDPQNDQSAQDPWTSEVGAGFYGFPVIEYPNRVMVGTIA